MRQEAFEVANASDWEKLEQELSLRARPGQRLKRLRTENDLPQRYRMLCHHLALARDRQYNAALVERLERLVFEAHHALYGARSGSARAWLQFLAYRFPRCVREHWRFVAVSAALLLGPMVVLIVALQRYPEAATLILSRGEMANVEESFDPDQNVLGRGRDAGTDMQMFGFYIYNNAGIGFRNYATGLLFGLGPIFFLTLNALHIGAAAGYVTYIGHGGPFWEFVSGHSAFELLAIVLSGAAGLRLGMAWFAPRRRTRFAALREAARESLPMVYGSCGMFIVAALLEAFWSPHRLLPFEVKIGFGIFLWILLLAYFGFAGRRRA